MPPVEPISPVEPMSSIRPMSPVESMSSIENLKLVYLATTCVVSTRRRTQTLESIRRWFDPATLVDH